MIKLNKKQFILTVILLLIFICTSVILFNFWSTSRYGKFIEISNMNVPRAGQNSILLKDGRVLVFGGESSSTTNTAEIFNPKTGKFKFIGNLTEQKFERNYSAILLQNGDVLIAGKDGANKKTILFNPKIDKFRVGPNMIYNRINYTATLLPNGNILIAGGKNMDLWGKNFNTAFIKNAEIYDYKQNKFILGPKMISPRFYNDAIRLKNGNVLILGGFIYKKFCPMEIYDYKNNSFKLFSNMNFKLANSMGLSKDRFLIIDSQRMGYTTTFTLYNIQNNKLQKIQSLKANNFRLGSACYTQLNDNRILLTGGQVGVEGLSLRSTVDSYIYDLKTNKIIKINNLNINRSGHSCLKIDKSKVLILGGHTYILFKAEEPTNKDELFVYKDEE